MFNFRKIAEVPVEQINEEASIFSKGRGRPTRFVEITLDTPLKALSRFFEWNSAAVVTERDGDGAGGMRPVAVVTKVDLLTWLMRQETANGSG